MLITLDRHECFSVFHHLQKDKQRKQRHSLKLGKKRRESSKRNDYMISPRVIIKAINIINVRTSWWRANFLILNPKYIFVGVEIDVSNFFLSNACSNSDEGKYPLQIVL